MALRLASRARLKRIVLRRHVATEREPRLRWRTEPYDPDKIHESARPANSMYYNWSRRANEGLKKMVRFGVLGFGAAAIITPGLYVAAYGWTSTREIAPGHRAIAEEEDTDAERFRWSSDSNLGYSGAWKHLATDPALPFNVRYYAVGSAIALHVARTDRSGEMTPCRLETEGLAPVVPLPRGYATAAANLQEALKLATTANLCLPHPSIVELECNLADVFDQSSSVEAAKAAVARFERVADSLVGATEPSQEVSRIERVRATRRAGEIARRLSVEQLVDPVQQELYRQRATRLLQSAIRLSMDGDQTGSAAARPNSRIRDWWWPLRWLMPQEKQSMMGRMPPQGDAVDIASRLSSASADLSPSLARSVVTSAGLLAALAVQRGDLASAELLSSSAIDFVRRHLEHSCVKEVLSRSPSASLHAHWLNVNDAALHSNLAELSAAQSPDQALDIATAASLQATSENIALRARFSTLLGDRSRFSKLVNPNGDPLEPLRGAVQSAVSAADSVSISAHLLVGALHELDGDHVGALDAYERAKLVSAGPAIEQAKALGEEQYLGGGLRGGALYDLQWERSNICVRRVKNKLARERGEQPPALPPKRAQKQRWIQRAPAWVQRGELSRSFVDFLEDQWEDSKQFVRM